jgi:hypothetical protein
MAAVQKLNMDMLKKIVSELTQRADIMPQWADIFTHEGGYLYQNGGFV